MATFPPSAVIVGAGPAGLTAALELLRNSDVAPLVVEASDTVGGLSRTVNYRGFRMDLGGHRFFSRSDWVMDWWQEILPIDPAASAEGERIRLAYQLALSRQPTAAEAARANAYLVAEARGLIAAKPAGKDAAPEHSWSTFCQALFACAEFRYLQ